MSQIVRPTADNVLSGWFSNLGIGENFYTTIDDTSADDDTSYVYGEYSAVNTAEGCGDIYPTTSASFKFGSLNTPYTSSGHKLRLRVYAYLYLEVLPISCYPKVYVRITQGVPSTSNTIFYDEVDYTIGSWNTYEYTLLSSEASQITDYSDLYIEFYLPETTTPSGTTLGKRTIYLRVTQVELEIPDATNSANNNFPLLINGINSSSGCWTTSGSVTSTDWHFPEYLSFNNWNSPTPFSFSSGNVCQVTPTGLWSNITNGNGDNDESFAYKILDEVTQDTSNYLQFKNYQFSGVIPTGAAIVGVEAKLFKTRWLDGGGTPDTCRDVMIKLNYGLSSNLSCGSCSSGLPNTWTIDSTWSNGSCSQCTGISGPQTLTYSSGCIWQTTETITCSATTLPKWKLEYNGSWGLTAGNGTTYTLSGTFNCTGNNLFEKNTDLLNCTEPTGVSLVYGSGTPSISTSCTGCTNINLIGNNKSGSWSSGSSTDAWPFGSIGTFIYGSSGDTWGYSLTRDVVTDCSFGISVLGEKNTDVFQEGITLGLDAAILRVWYRTTETICPYFPMFISGASNTGSSGGTDGFFPLYTSGSTPSGDFPFYIEGNQPKSGDFPCYISGSASGLSGTFPLFTEGATTATGSINLYLYNDSSQGKSGIVPLSILGYTYSGIQNTFSLFTSGDNTVSGSLNLYINSEASNPSGSINLYTSGDYGTAVESFPLFIESFGSSGILPLFTLGSGILNNGYPASGSINLYLHRPTLVENNIPLFINANTTSGGFPMVITGVGNSSGNLPLYTSGIGSPTGTIPLYTHGF